MAHASQHVNVVKVERMNEEDIEYRENTIAMPSLLACLLSVPVIDGHPSIHPSVGCSFIESSLCAHICSVLNEPSLRMMLSLCSIAIW